MKEYIEREAAIHAVVKRFWRKPYISDVELAQAVRDVDAVDVVERKRGEWAIDKEDLEWGNALKRRYCTNCKKRPHFDKEERVFVLTDFCPNCGADMRVSHREE